MSGVVYGPCHASKRRVATHGNLCDVAVIVECLLQQVLKAGSISEDRRIFYALPLDHQEGSALSGALCSSLANLPFPKILNQFNRSAAWASQLQVYRIDGNLRRRSRLHVQTRIVSTTLFDLTLPVPRVDPIAVRHENFPLNRKSVVSGKRVSVRLALGG